jgi:hypothetical protein
MSFLTINGFNVVIDSSQATRNEDEIGGQDVRAFDGTLLSTQRWAKKSATVTTPPLSAAEQTTVLALVGTGKTVTGDIFGAGGTTCTVRCLNGPYRRSWGNTVKRRLTLTIRQE